MFFYYTQTFLFEKPQVSGPNLKQSDQNSSIGNHFYYFDISDINSYSRLTGCSNR